MAQRRCKCHVLYHLPRRFARWSQFYSLDVLVFNLYALYRIRMISSVSVFELTMNKLFVFVIVCPFSTMVLSIGILGNCIIVRTTNVIPHIFIVTKISKRTTIEAFFSSIVSYKSRLLANIPSTKRCIALINFNYNVKQRT